MSFRDTSQFLGDLGVHRSHVAVHNWVHKAELQPISTLSADQLAVDEKTTRLHGEDIWLYGVLGIPDSDGLRESNALPNAVDPETNEMGIGTASDVSSER